MASLPHPLVWPRLAVPTLLSKQNTAPAQGDDVAANHIPCPTEPKIVAIGFEVEESESVGVWVINSPWSLAHRLAPKAMTCRRQAGRQRRQSSAVACDVLILQALEKVHILVEDAGDEIADALPVGVVTVAGAGDDVSDGGGRVIEVVVWPTSQSGNGALPCPASSTRTYSSPPNGVRRQRCGSRLCLAGPCPPIPCRGSPRRRSTSTTAPHHRSPASKTSQTSARSGSKLRTRVRSTSGRISKAGLCAGWPVALRNRSC
jgi:hypothetical protein